MKWNEMTTVQKALTVIEFVSSLLFWALFLLSSFDMLKAKVVLILPLLVSSVCRIFTERYTVMKVIWGIFVAIACMLLVVSLLIF